MHARERPTRYVSIKGRGTAAVVNKLIVLSHNPSNIASPTTSGGAKRRDASKSGKGGTPKRSPPSKLPPLKSLVMGKSRENRGGKTQGG